MKSRKQEILQGKQRSSVSKRLCCHLCFSCQMSSPQIKEHLLNQVSFPISLSVFCNERKCTLETSAFLFSPSTEEENHRGLVVICLCRFFVSLFTSIPALNPKCGFQTIRKSCEGAFGLTTQTQCMCHN